MENRDIEAIVRAVVEKAAGRQNPESAPEAGHPPAAGRTGTAEACGPDGDYAPGAAGPGHGAAMPSGDGKPVPANGGLVRVSMPLAKAVELIGKIEAKAAEWDMRVVTAVSDAAGRPVAVHCMDGAYIGSFDVALNKTYTSIAFQMSTARLGSLSGPGGSLYGIQFTNNGRIVIFGGGEVLRRGEVIVGALGVSGGSAEQDTALAAYGKSIFAELE